MSPQENHHRLTPQRAGEHKAEETPTAELVAMGREVFVEEAAALQAISDRLEGSFAHAVRMLYACRGRVLVTGLGKSGLVGRKIAATLTSTGTPSIFVHPVEALHGDLGIATPDDLLLAISRSGHNSELLSVVNSLKAAGLRTIAIVGALDSPLARAVEVALDMAVEREVCPLNLTPTTSATATQVMGDALTVCLLRLRAFQREDFAVFHPSGTLGRTLRMTVSDLMHSGEELPLVGQDQPLREAVIEIARQRLGCACVVDGEGRLCGFLTNGDLQRVLLHHSQESGDALDRPVSEFMSRQPRTVAPDCLARAALQSMEQNPSGPITQLVVTEEGRPLGVIHLHDILRQGLSG